MPQTRNRFCLHKLVLGIVNRFTTRCFYKKYLSSKRNELLIQSMLVPEYILLFVSGVAVTTVHPPYYRSQWVIFSRAHEYHDLICDSGMH